MMTAPSIYLDLSPALASELFSSTARARLDSVGTVLDPGATSADRLRADILVTGWGSAPVPPHLPAEHSLRLLVHSAGTIRQLVPKSIIEDGLRVCQASAGMAQSVAELATSFTLSLLRGLHHVDASMRRRDWAAAGRAPLGRTASGSTVGVVGASRVGRQYIQILVALGADVVVHDPYVEATELSAMGARTLPLEELLGTADVVALHAPVTNETLGLLDAERLALIRDGGVVVNTARSALIDADALLAELSTGRLSAGLDVFPEEPLPDDHPLWRLPNVILTPHIGAWTHHSRRTQGDIVVAEIERFVAGLPLLHEVHATTYDLMA